MTGRFPRISPVLSAEANFLVKTCEYRQQVTGGSYADGCDRDIAMGVPVMIESGRTVLAWGRGSGCDEPDIRGDHEEAVNHSWRPALLFVTALPQIPATRDGFCDKEPDEPRP